MMALFGLLPLPRGQSSTDYDDSFDPRINNEFATAAFRFGHSLVMTTFVVKPKRSVPQFVKLKDTFFRPGATVSTQTTSLRLNYSAVDTFAGLLRGLTEEETLAWDNNFVPDIRDHLFERSPDRGGLDLVALNVQRGRDHGLPGYVSYLRECTGNTLGSSLTDWSDLHPFIPPAKVKQLSSIYHSIEDVDLFAGGFMERPHEDALVGPTFKCIIGDQFARLKKGDRFFYDLRSSAIRNNNNGASGDRVAFRTDQLDTIRQAR